MTYDCATLYGDAFTSYPSACAVEAGNDLSCILDPDHSGLRVEGGAGNDGVVFCQAGATGGFPAGAPYKLAADGNDGNDTLIGGDADETLAGAAGPIA